jgi:hypothetical protein
MAIRLLFRSVYVGDGKKVVVKILSLRLAAKTAQDGVVELEGRRLGGKRIRDWKI